MPLRWERAAGGPETSNPVGVRLDAQDTYGSTALPNLQPPGIHLAARGDHVAPTGFGPIATSWPTRREKRGGDTEAWSSRWMDTPLPADIESSFFNVAPRDQQIEALRDDERLVLENLHPDHPYLVTSLPGVRPLARVERPGAKGEEMVMTAETLWIDTERGICTLTWRGTVSLNHPEEPGRVLITWDGVRAQPRTGPLPPPPADEGDGTRTIAPFLMRSKGPDLPFSAKKASDGDSGARLSVPVAPRLTADLASGTIEEVSIDEMLPDEPPDDAGATMVLPVAQKVAAPEALPFVERAPAPTLPFGPEVPSPDLTPPAMIQAPIAAGPIAPSMGVSPWTGAGAAIAAPSVVAPALMTDLGRAPPAAVGVQAASNAAASGSVPRRMDEAAQMPSFAAEPKPKTRAPREPVKLLWFDPKAVARIRKHLDWRVTLAELELRLLDEDRDDEDESAAGEPDPKDRRDVFEVLLKASALGVNAVKRALDGAVDEDGRFTAPLVLLSGELELPFDEVETLKATAMAARPLSGGDKKLKEALDVVDELLKTPWLSGSGGIAEGLTEKVREAFASAKRMVPGDYLDAHTERMLLEQRAYQRRTVYGRKWIRSVMRAGSGGGSVPVYLPEALKDELPMFRRFKVKLIGEVDMREDQGESSGCAVKVVALGRVLT
jgi:hypothetical protein